MRITEKAAGWLVVVVLATALFYLAWPAMPTGFKEWLLSEKGAAWIQAAGSLAAIVAGAMAVRWQVGHQYRQDEQRRQQHQLSVLTDVLDVLGEAIDSLGRIAEATTHWSSCEPSKMSVLVAWSLVPMLEAMNAFDVNAIPAARIRLHFVRTRTIVEAVRDQTLAFCRNAQRDVADSEQLERLNKTATLGWEEVRAYKKTVSLIVEANPIREAEREQYEQR